MNTEENLSLAEEAVTVETIHPEVMAEEGEVMVKIITQEAVMVQLTIQEADTLEWIIPEVIVFHRRSGEE